MALSHAELISLIAQLADEECLVVFPNSNKTKPKESSPSNNPQPTQPSKLEIAKTLRESLARRGATRRKTKEIQWSLEYFLKSLDHPEQKLRMEQTAALFIEFNDFVDFGDDELLQIDLKQCIKEFLNPEREDNVRDEVITRVRYIFPELVCLKVTEL